MVAEIKGFQVLPVRLPEGAATHYVYFKKHDAKGPATGSGSRSIFFFNLPIDTSTSQLRKYFQDVAIGATLESYVSSLLTDSHEDVYVDLVKLTSDLEFTQDANDTKEVASRLPKNCAIATFIDKSAYQLAFSALRKLAAEGTVSSWPKVKHGGSAYFLAKYRAQVLNPDRLAAEVALALADFDRAENESVQLLRRQTQLVDEDGFTLVVGSHRKTKAGVLGKQKLAATVELDKANAAMKKKEKEDFYRFQLRQRKKEEMNDLLRKFKLDQEKVRLMREKKRFRPY